MSFDWDYCPFLHWESLSNRIPEEYLSYQGGTYHFSWFMSAPKYSTYRVNINKYSVNFVVNKLTEDIRTEASLKSWDVPEIHSHALLPDCIVIGPWKHETGTNPDSLFDDVIVDVPCANAVLRGADVFSPGILGLYASTKIGDVVNIYADIDQKCRRGYLKKFQDRKFYVGYGILKIDRDTLFKNNAIIKGVGVEVLENLSGIPRIRMPKDYGILQNLPSIICGHLFCNITGDVLDMCAAPGNKTSHIAALLSDKGCVTALDKTPQKVARLAELCSEMGLTNVYCFKYDSTQCVARDPSKILLSNDKNEEVLSPPFSAETFSAVLLDPPCSGLGQRPILANKITARQLKSCVSLQRKLFRNAVELTKQNGMLVYSTCTITREENEEIVVWALKEFPNLRLQALDHPHLGKPGIKTANLSEESRLLVNRFGNYDSATPTEDTIGFFIARFIKTSHFTGDTLCSSMTISVFLIS